MRHMLVTVIAALLLSSCTSTKVEGGPDAQTSSSLTIKDGERAELMTDCVENRLENAATCACQIDVTATYSNQQQWDAALAMVRTGEVITPDFDETSQEDEDRDELIMTALDECHAMSNEAILVNICTESGDNEYYCNCMASGMKGGLTPPIYREIVAAMERSEDINEVMSRLSEDSPKDLEMIETLDGSCMAASRRQSAE